MLVKSQRELTFFIFCQSTKSIKNKINFWLPSDKDDSFGQNFVSSYLEEGVWKPMKKSLYSVRIVSYSDMHKISVQDLRKILNVYPEFSYRFLEKFQVTFDISKVLPASNEFNHFYIEKF